MPGYVPTEMMSFVQLLLCRSARRRLQNATGVGITDKRLRIQVPEEDASLRVAELATDFQASDKKPEYMPFHSQLSQPQTDNKEEKFLALADLSYRRLKMHSFFTDFSRGFANNRILFPSKFSLQCAESNTFIITSVRSAIDSEAAHDRDDDCSDPLCSLDTFESIHSWRINPFRVPKLSELCIRAVGSACVHLAELISNNGGLRPKIPWMQGFDLHRIPRLYREHIAYYLSQHKRLHQPSVYRLFFTNLVDCRNIKANVHSKEYLGFTRNIHGHWGSDFSFIYLANPQFGRSNCTSLLAQSASESSIFATEVEKMRQIIGVLNKLRPK